MNKQNFPLKTCSSLKWMITLLFFFLTLVFLSCGSSPEAFPKESDSEAKEATINNKLFKLAPDELSDRNPFDSMFKPVEKALDENNFQKASQILEGLLEDKGHILAIRAWIAYYSNFTHNKAFRAEDIAALIIQEVTREKEKEAPELAYAKAIALTSLGQSAVTRAKYDQALTYLKEAVSLFPTLATPRALIGDVYKSRAQHQRALEWYQSSLAIDHDYHYAQAGMVEIFWKTDDHNKALEMLQQALNKNPQNPYLLKQRGIIFYEMGYFIDAETDIRNALKEKSWDALLWVELGNTLDMQGRSDEAVKAYKKAIQLNPCQKGSHFNLAICYYGQNKFEEALREIEFEEQLTPVDEPGVYRLKIELLRQLQQDKKIPDVQKKLDSLEAN